MPLVAMTLAAVAQMCAPRVAPRTTLAVMQVESSGRPWTINDNDAGRAYYEATKADAVRLAGSLLSAGHNIDMGLMQVNSSHLPELQLSLDQLFDPCVNVAVGSTILTRAYRTAASRYGPGEVALAHAFEVYNSGRVNGAPKYAHDVWNAGVALARSGW
jgi:type IV secretion system protein VirB1